ncbi:MAG: DUF547 domain-containing protein [Pikeienuella sp.]
MRLLLLVAVLVPAVLGALERLAAPDAALSDPIWKERSAGSQIRIDHGPWDRFLAQFVATDAAGVNRVAYGRVGPAEKSALAAYIAQLEAVDPRDLGGAEQLAYWINLYNAATVRLVLDHYPVESIREIGAGLFDDGPWSREVATVLGRKLTLDEIEHGIIRPVWNEPRIHYAVNCAAVGCPNLSRTAFRGATLEAQLAAAERAFVNDPRGIRLEGDALVLSKIWLWFREDFAEDEAGLLERLRETAQGRTAAALAGRRKVDRYAYDWDLNDRR